MGHTPGPWAHKLKDSRIVSLSSWFVEPDVEAGDEGIRTSIIDLYGAMGGKDTDADANLMAASPELVEALEGLDLDEYEELLFKCYEGSTEYGGFKDAMAAIDKARQVMAKVRKGGS